MSRKKINKKRAPKTKADLIFQMRCNEIAAKNVRKFMAGEVTVDDLFKKALGVEERKGE